MSYTVQPGLTLYFIRHGQTDWNLEGRLQGRMDKPLNDTGREQAARNGRALSAKLGRAEGFDFIASPMMRTCETMEIARTQMNLPPQDYQSENRLKEISFGDWEGHTLAEIEVSDRAGNAARAADKWGWVPPNGESYEMLYHRIGSWLQGITHDSVIVSHGGVMRAYRLVLQPDLDPQEVPHMDVPQDKVLCFSGGEISWL